MINVYYKIVGNKQSVMFFVFSGHVTRQRTDMFTIKKNINTCVVLT